MSGSSASQACLWGSLQLLSTGSVFRGLKMVRGKLVLDVAFFSCCRGEGFCASSPAVSVLTGKDASRDSLACDFKRCSLTERWQKSLAVMSDFERSVGAQVHLEQWEERAALLGARFWLDRTWDQELCCGVLRPEVQKSDMWTLGLVFSWLGNLRCKMISLDHTHDLDVWQGLGESDVVLVRGTHKLASEHSRYLFERLVLQCYHFAKPLWTLESLQPRNPRRSLYPMKSYVDDLKKRSPLSYLSSSSLWKFKEVCSSGNKSF